MARGRHANAATGAFGGAPLWGHDPREGCTEMARGSHANAATGAFGYRATILVGGASQDGPREPDERPKKGPRGDLGGSRTAGLIEPPPHIFD
eukprot:1801444-Pyramimonas_sp.AAC.1